MTIIRIPVNYDLNLWNFIVINIRILITNDILEKVVFLLVCQLEWNFWLDLVQRWHVITLGQRVLFLMIQVHHDWGLVYEVLIITVLWMKGKIC